MVKIPSFRAGATPAQEESAIRTGARHSADQAMADRAAAERAADREENRQIAAERDRIGYPVGGTTDVERTADLQRHRELEREAAGPKPRASLLATLSLTFGVAAALVALTGLLAAGGIVLGVIAVLLGIGGIWGTRRRHVAGKTDALIGLLLGLAAVVVGALALTGAWSWLTGDTNMVERVREWLDAQFVNRI